MRMASRQGAVEAVAVVVGVISTGGCDGVVECGEVDGGFCAGEGAARGECGGGVSFSPSFYCLSNSICLLLLDGMCV